MEQAPSTVVVYRAEGLAHSIGALQPPCRVVTVERIAAIDQEFMAGLDDGPFALVLGAAPATPTDRRLLEGLSLLDSWTVIDAPDGDDSTDAAALLQGLGVATPAPPATAPDADVPGQGLGREGPEPVRLSRPPPTTTPDGVESGRSEGRPMPTWAAGASRPGRPGGQGRPLSMPAWVRIGPVDPAPAALARPHAMLRAAAPTSVSSSVDAGPGDRDSADTGAASLEDHATDNHAPSHDAEDAANFPASRGTSPSATLAHTTNDDDGSSNAAAAESVPMTAEGQSTHGRASLLDALPPPPPPPPPPPAASPAPTADDGFVDDGPVGIAAPRPPASAAFDTPTARVVLTTVDAALSLDLLDALAGIVAGVVEGTTVHTALDPPTGAGTDLYCLDPPAVYGALDVLEPTQVILVTTAESAALAATNVKLHQFGRLQGRADPQTTFKALLLAIAPVAERASTQLGDWTVVVADPDTLVDADRSPAVASLASALLERDDDVVATTSR